MAHPVSGLAHALSALAEQRDPVAWALLVERAGPEMARIAYRLAGDAALADDAVQEAFLSIRDGAKGFAPRTAAPDDDAWRWIMRVTSNAALQLLRRKRRDAAQDRRGHAEQRMTPAAPESDLERSEQATLVRRELAELPEPTRAAIVLHCVEGLGYDQIAAELRIPVGTAKTRVHRGLESLRERLLRVGCALSLTAVTGALQTLPAATVPVATTAWLPLLTSTKASTVGAVSTGTMTMATKCILGLAAGLIATAIPLALSQEAPVPAPTPAPKSAPATAPAKSSGAAIGVGATAGVPKAAPTNSNDEAVRKKLEQRISVDFQDSDFIEVIKMLQRLTGANIVVDPQVLSKPPPTITLQAKEIAAQDVFAFVAQIAGLRVQIRDGAVFFTK